VKDGAVIQRIRRTGGRRPLVKFPNRVEATLERQIRYLEDRTRYLIVNNFAPRLVCYYDIREDSFVCNEPALGTLFKRRSMAAAVMRLLGRDVEIVRCKVDNKGKLVKRSVHVGGAKANRALSRRSTVRRAQSRATLASRHGE
jgi:hypothetical protein